LVARYGGEEFVVVLENCDQTEAAATAELTRAAVESLGLGHRGSPLGVVTLSIGVAQGEMRRPSDAAELFELADSALYMAKRMGRNRVGRVQDAIAAGESASSSAVTSVLVDNSEAQTPRQEAVHANFEQARQRELAGAFLVNRAEDGVQGCKKLSA
jgi:predicted signal transduction protein with EAL and GGDEF domain